MQLLEYTILNIPILEWIGYVASALVLLSLSMNSIIKLRWYNMAGAILFSTYGFLIGSLPVGIMNALIVCANIYNLYKIYTFKDSFVAIELKDNPELLSHFLDCHAEDIQKFFPHFEQQPTQKGFFVLQNMAVAGVFVGRIEGERMYIDLDYALPAYRDFKVGNFLYPHLNKLLAPTHIKEVCCRTAMTPNYMQKMGFEKRQEGGATLMIKTL